MMTQPNPNWPRWIFASIADYFKTAAQAIPLPLLVEGIDERMGDDEHYSHAELRINGPSIQELSKGYFRLQVGINVLLTELMERTHTYDLQDWCGAFSVAMDGPINLYHYGPDTGGVDDGQWFDCLLPLKSKFDPNRIFHFGQISKTDRVRQSMVDGAFVVYLTIP
jgi:hypothetical protein